MPEKYRVIVAKPGLDGHDRGAKIVARALRDAGFEVIYTGLHQTPEQIVETAIQEDADAVGLSLHSGAHMTLFPRVVALLRERGAGDIVVFGGGIIPADDITALEADGVEKIFTPGAPTGDIVAWLQQRLAPIELLQQVQVDLFHVALERPCGRDHGAQCVGAAHPDLDREVVAQRHLLQCGDRLVEGHVAPCVEVAAARVDLEPP
jgi:methylmalonyl-CoA mutase C-terminal domain/subunit